MHLDLTTDTIGIKSNTLSEGDMLKFVATAVKNGNPNPAEATYITSVNYPPYSGSCSISPSEGKEMHYLGFSPT